MPPAVPVKKEGSTFPKPSRAGATTSERRSDGRTARKTTLSRDEVGAGLKAVSARVGRCGSGSGGVATVEIVVGGSGRVVKAVVTGLTGGADKRCVAREAKKARFPRFDGKPITVNYPFRL